MNGDVHALVLNHSSKARHAPFPLLLIPPPSSVGTHTYILATENTPGYLTTSAAFFNPLSMSTHRSDHNPPGDIGPPLNTMFGPTANFITVLELFCAQREAQVHPQAPPPSPSLAVHYSPDNDPMALGDILASQIAFVTNQEFEQLRQAVPSQPEGIPTAAIIEGACTALPFLSNDLVNSSIAIMENIANHTEAATLPVQAVPPEIWAALRATIPSQGSRLSNAVSSSPAFSTACIPDSGNSSPMEDPPTNTPLQAMSLEASQASLGIEANPIWVSSGNETPHANSQAISDHMRSFSVNHTPGPYNPSPEHTLSHHADSRVVSMRALINVQNSQDNFLDALATSNTLITNAETAVKRTLEELNEGVEGYSHYFLNEPLTICTEPAIKIVSPHLRHILDIAGTALSMGPHNENDSDIWRMLCPSDWYWASTYMLASVLRGCVRTPRVARMGNFPLLPLCDSFLYGNLPELETQVDTLKAMAMQILENLQMDNVWRSHEAHIRAIVEHKALKVEHRLSTLGLSDLIDKLEKDAPIEEITDTLCDDISEQIRSKYNNKILVAKSNAYKQALAAAEQEGRAQAANATESYIARLMDTAKEQAHLKADSKFSQLLADKCSKIAPKVDAEIVEEHTKFISEHRQTLIAQLDSLSLDAEKEFVLATATRLGLTLEGSSQPSKKPRIDNHKIPDFGGDKDDSVAPSITPSVAPTTDKGILIHAMNEAIASAMGPIWATLRRLEAEVRGGPVRIPPRAGPGYRAEHHRIIPTQQAHSVVPVPELTNQGSTSQTVAQDVIPSLLSDKPTRTSANKLPHIDDEEFPALGEETAISKN
ncbi:hypothetical protein V8E53_004188 [Lactarius tabidus]